MSFLTEKKKPGKAPNRVFSVMPFKQQWWADSLCMGVWENHLDERGDLLAHEQTKPQHNESPQPILGFEAKSVFWVQVDFCPFIVETKEELNKNIYIDNRQWCHPASVPAPLTFAQPTFSSSFPATSNLKGPVPRSESAALGHPPDLPWTCKQHEARRFCTKSTWKTRVTHLGTYKASPKLPRVSD